MDFTLDALHAKWRAAGHYCDGVRDALDAAGGSADAPRALVDLWFDAMDARTDAFNALQAHREQQDA